MDKKILVTSTDLMMIQFLVPHIINLSLNGYDVDIACSNVGNRIDEIRLKLQPYIKEMYIVHLHRSPLKLDNFNGYKELRRIIDDGNYNVIWTNEPVMSVVTRLAAKNSRKKGTKVLYMVHGFHFFNGAPKKNWIVYYPIEKIMASKADVICTVNKEDFKRAKTFNVNRVEYIHGIGINTDRLTKDKKCRSIREELNLPLDSFIVLSVGELNKNKNQKVIIEALNKLSDKKIHYILCGKGDQLEYLQSLASSFGLDDNVHFLGYRNDVVDICSQANVFVMPSLREGLPVASLEAMYCGLPLIVSKTRGLVDVIQNGISGLIYEPHDSFGFSHGIKKIKDNPNLAQKMGENNIEIVKPFCLENTKREVLRLINSIY